MWGLKPPLNAIFQLFGLLDGQAELLNLYYLPVSDHCHC